MDTFQAIVLGAVQGLTEFIPISSSGHLVLVPEVLGWERPGLAFDVLLHVGSLLALIVYFWSDLVTIVKGVFGNEPGARRMGLMLVVGTIPAGLAGLLLGDYFEKAFEDASAAAVQLVITAAILVGAELILASHKRAQRRLREFEDITVFDSLIVGIAQAIAIFPGISRSGSTIAAGLALRIDRDSAARFAFLLAIPALAGAAVVQIPKLDEVTLSAGAAIGGLISSLVFSYIAIAGLIRYLRSNTLYPFAVYCVVAGVIFYLLV